MYHTKYDVRNNYLMFLKSLKLYNNFTSRGKYYAQDTQSQE